MLSIKDMGMLVIMFLKRAEENYLKYVAPTEFNRMCNELQLKEYFFVSSSPLDSFEDFEKAYKINWTE